MQIDATYDEIAVLARWNADQSRQKSEVSDAHKKRAQDLQQVLVTPRTVTATGLEGMVR